MKITLPSMQELETMDPMLWDHPKEEHLEEKYLEFCDMADNMVDGYSTGDMLLLLERRYTYDRTETFSTHDSNYCSVISDSEWEELRLDRNRALMRVIIAEFEKVGYENWKNRENYRSTSPPPEEVKQQIGKLTEERLQMKYLQRMVDVTPNSIVRFESDGNCNTGWVVGITVVITVVVVFALNYFGVLF